MKIYVIELVGGSGEVFLRYANDAYLGILKENFIEQQ